MKVSEVTVQRYCDFCSPEKKTKGVKVCSVCQSDICDTHLNLVPVKKSQNPLRQKSDRTDSQMRILFEYEIQPVCIDCSFQSYSNLLDTLNQRRGERVRGKEP